MNNKQALLGMIDAAFDDRNQRAALRNIVEALFGDDEPTAEQPRQWPPAGMAIQVYMDSTWEMARTYNDNGIAEFSLSYVDLRKTAWRYCRAPAAWPNGAKCWVGNSHGEYQFLYDGGETVGKWYPYHGTILSIEHRPEEA